MILKASDLDLNVFPSMSKWPEGVNVKEGNFGFLLVSKTRSQEEYHNVGHDYSKVSGCDCKHHTEGHQYCRHMEVGQYVLDQRKERIKKKKMVTSDTLSAKMEKSPLNGSRPFSLNR